MARQEWQSAIIRPTLSDSIGLIVHHTVIFFLAWHFLVSCYVFVFLLRFFAVSEAYRRCRVARLFWSHGAKHWRKVARKSPNFHSSLHSSASDLRLYRSCCSLWLQQGYTPPPVRHVKYPFVYDCAGASVACLAHSYQCPAGSISRIVNRHPQWCGIAWLRAWLFSKTFFRFSKFFRWYIAYSVKQDQIYTRFPIKSTGTTLTRNSVQRTENSGLATHISVRSLNTNGFMCVMLTIQQNVCERTVSLSLPVFCRSPLTAGRMKIYRVAFV